MDPNEQPTAAAYRNCLIVLLALVVGGYFGWQFISGLKFSSSPSSSTPRDPGMSKEEGMATMINLHGHLCARVVFVHELSGGERQVNCEEYRDPRGARTEQNLVVYMVNLDQNTVRRVGPN